MRRKALVLVAALFAATVVPAGTAHAVDDIDTSSLRRAVTVAGILTHERAFQRIANENGGTRASGTPGYDASVRYVRSQLTAAGYRVSVQRFDYSFFQELAPSTLSQTAPTATDYESATLDYSGSGSVTGALAAPANTVVPATEAPSSAAGCAVTDFAPAPSAPSVALIQRGTCTFEAKAANAAAAGYDAAIIFNEGQAGRDELLTGTLGNPAAIPVVGISYADGAALYSALLAGPVEVSVSTSTESDIRPTYNVLADTPGGNANKTIVVGAHLDSVLAGPGINDNGSGASTILEIALQGAKTGLNPRQKVRFAFWGAEEAGLLGSEHYVSTLSDAAIAKIYANLNFDMLGSSNYVRFVYDGDGSAADDALSGPPGSAQIEQVFTDYFATQNLPTSPTAFDGRSDYGPFIAAGIPSGGLFSGAEGVKRVEEAAVYGGEADVAYDSCYHQACDDITNLNTRALSELGDAAADAVATLAFTKSGFFEDGSRVAPRGPVATDSFEYQGSSQIR